MEVRWNSAQAMAASLVQVCSEVMSFHGQYNSDDPKDSYPMEFQPLGDSNFWASLKKADRLLMPLAKCSLVIQKDATILADVFLMYAHIYRALCTFIA